MCGGMYTFAGCKDPTELYLFKFGWGDVGETKSSKKFKLIGCDPEY